jgi:hypothetical protein
MQGRCGVEASPKGIGEDYRGVSGLRPTREGHWGGSSAGLGSIYAWDTLAAAQDTRGSLKDAFGVKERIVELGPFKAVNRAFFNQHCLPPSPASHHSHPHHLTTTNDSIIRELTSGWVQMVEVPHQSGDLDPRTVPVRYIWRFGMVHGCG